MSEQIKKETQAAHGKRVPAYVWVTLGVTLLTLLLHAIGMSGDLVNVALIYLFPVLVSAVYWGMGPAVYAASFSVIMFDFFFVPPYLSFTVEDLRYLISFVVYLAVAILTASLAGRLRQQLEMVKAREATTNSLYALSRQMTAITDLNTLLVNIATQVSLTLGKPAAVYLPDGQGDLLVTSSSAPASEGEKDGWGDGESEIAIAKWVYNHGQIAGKGSSALRESPGLYVPLRTEEQIHGVLAVSMDVGEVHEQQEQQEQLRLLEACGGLAAGAIARVKLAEEARLAQITAESERIRTALLDSVSHELRTPLTAIIGSATGLLENDILFTPEDRRELTGNIRDGALRMNRLVTNLLGMVRLESGMLQLNRKWCEVGDMISVVLTQVREFSPHRNIQVELPDDPAFIYGDEVLLEQVLVNIVSNAIKYSPDETQIVIIVANDRSPNQLTIMVADQGIGIPEAERLRIFDKFYRSESTQHVTGTGLGLAICKGIVEVHGGTIVAEPNSGGGTRMRIDIPMEAHGPRFPYSEQGEVEE
ncbi:ATP-binding protein [Paenibacillus sp. BGI2013]|uniref:ATP-binding protein n=1 Tax=Paenibacillus sp. BGI2013 TaxID=2058902 RepID=UPI00214C9808|nr:ATP-binding protein [Paenibacillus sp. BGI2013]